MKPRIAAITFFVSALFLLSCSQLSDSQALEWKLTSSQQQWVDKTLAHMTVEEKVGQLLAPAISPQSAGQDSAYFEMLINWIEKYHIGHIYIASSPLNPIQVAQLINTLQEKSDIALLIHSDLECGLGDRFDGGTIFPPLMGLSHTRSQNLAYEMAKITAIEARALGIHLINSPVLDVNLNTDNPVINIRSFGDDPQLVSEFAVTFMRGLQENGLLGAAKHFPGHGDVAVDSHSKIPVIHADRQRLDKVELYPYKQAISAGLMSMMTAHISVPALDPTLNLPATLSKPIMTDLFRDEMGFKGLIITDAFDMGGLLDFGSFEESAMQSIVAGNDVVLLWTKPRFETVFPHFIESIKNGSVPESRIDESVRRILDAKVRLGLHQQKLVNIDDIPNKVGIPQHVKKADETFEKAVVLLKNKNNIIPLKDKKIAIISINDDDNHFDIGKTFLDEISQRSDISSTFYAEPKTGDEDFINALEKARDADVIVVGLFVRVFARRGSARIMHKNILNFITELVANEKPVVIVSFGSPYLISQFPAVDAYMISTEPTWEFYGYDKHRPGQIVAAKALFGENDITGKLSVTIPELYSFDDGISLATQK